MKAFGIGSPAGLCDVMSRFSRQSIRLSLRILSCDERENSHSHRLFPDILRHSIDSFGHRPTPYLVDTSTFREFPKRRNDIAVLFLAVIPGHVVSSRA